MDFFSLVSQLREKTVTVSDAMRQREMAANEIERLTEASKIDDAEKKRMRTELSAALADIEYAVHEMEKARVWGGMDWHYNPLHPLHYRNALERLRNALNRASAPR
jgi:hypothetical protein